MYNILININLITITDYIFKNINIVFFFRVIINKFNVYFGIIVRFAIYDKYRIYLNANKITS